jgi:hypothetical protein
LKVLTPFSDPAGGGTTSNAIAALEYVLPRASTIRVCLLSFQTGNVHPTLNYAVDVVANAGVLMVCSAGNDSPPIDAGGVSPASAAQAITVGAMIDSDGKAWSLGGIGIDDVFSGFSNYGRRLDFTAPGGGGAYNVYSTIPIAGQIQNGLSIPYDDKIYGTFGRPATGTSFAAAHVAGMLAFLTDPQTTAGYVFPHGISTFRPLMTNRVSAINALYRLTHNSGWHNDTVRDPLGNVIPVANFYVNQFLQ